MRSARSEARFSRSRTRKLTPALLAIALGAAPVAQAHSVHVAPRGNAPDAAAHALELRLDDPARVSPVDAYVAIGPEQGLASETALAVALSLDLGRLRAVASEGRPALLPFLRLATARDPESTKLVLFLSSDPRGGWSLGAWSWDDTLGRYTLVGQAPLVAGSTSRASAAVRVALEWAAATPDSVHGSLRLLRVDDGDARTLLFERTDLDNGGQAFSHARLGVLAAERALGVTGSVQFDDFEIARIAVAAPDDASAR